MGSRAESTGILFCPYCRESFEGLDECPEHSLTLVAIDRLPKDPSRTPDRVSFFLDPRYGRGAVLAGAIVTLIAFCIPFVQSGAVVESALEVAIDGAHNLWLTPGAALAVLLILARSRSLVAMAATRGAIVALSLGALLPLGYTVRRIHIVANVESAEITWRIGLPAMVVACLAVAIGGVFLGRVTRRRR